VLRVSGIRKYRSPCHVSFAIAGAIGSTTRLPGPSSRRSQFSSDHAGQSAPTRSRYRDTIRHVRSADYRTEHFDGYSHLHAGPPWIHVAWREDGSPWGDYTLDQITELAELAEQAWPGLAASLAEAAAARKLEDVPLTAEQTQAALVRLGYDPGVAARAITAATGPAQGWQHIIGRHRVIDENGTIDGHPVFRIERLTGPPGG
jgi:hypothetical protein